ncbi:hypothetical protein Desaci_0269 [Desulfosporosinus acidiphilus SJ4]|uniref:Uncharacterized protein n=1 Tax=Desulfosporosinus acidiphilus (strain DSM 22704 / JCM 16185 / SJ4) TaxID=646529 RepID=I4D0L7_DESAJ|nr:hypothetical protein [Desulfosporosinus acidiphilus]AFM39341.1 hypothetical protein Desaci_0269 [Desulfosporosinus acidiphilus SJ4]
MKFTKKTTMILSFTLGAMLLATTALADIAAKSGYDQLKDALKVTASQCSDNLNSFTMDLSYDLKDNGKTLATLNQIEKFDRTKNAIDRSSSEKTINGNNYSNQTYSDKTTFIRQSNDDPTYYVTEYTQGRNDQTFSNPFKNNNADDVEKIADAIVGNLKDNVAVTENPDGSKVLSGSLTEVQIPSLINALASFEMKQRFNGQNGQQDNSPQLSKDVFVKNIDGTAKINKDGIMESILGSAVVSGKDEKGNVHDITIEVLAKLTEINSTVVTKPDLNGKKVVKNVVETVNSGPGISNPQKFMGKFKNDILITKDGKFVKIGERIIEITQIDQTSATGRYYEVYKPGFDQYATTKRNFNFNATRSKDKNSPNYNYSTDTGSKGDFFLDEHAGKIYLNGNIISAEGAIFDSSFSPDFE